MAGTSTKDLSILVRRTLKDLAVIRRSLLEISEEESSGNAEACQVIDLELAAELKSVVDAIRLLLWAYIKALSAKSGRSPAEVLNLYKMELAVEMLRNVRTRTAPRGFISDFEQLVNETLAATPPKPRIQ
jgi:hypothetical protein